MVRAPRFYVPFDVASGYDGIREGLRWLLGWVREHPDEKAPLIVAPTLNQLRLIDLLAAACSTMKCASRRTWQQSGWHGAGPGLLLFPDRDTLGEFDEVARTALCVVPSSSERIDYWVRARNAVDATGHVTTSAPRELVSNPVVREALIDIGVVVNKAHLVNYEDRAIAVRVLQLSHRSGERFEPTEVHAWA